MAGRTRKTGVDWFPHFCNPNTQPNNDVKSLRAMYGNDAMALYYICLEHTGLTIDGRLDVSHPARKATLALEIMVPLEKFEAIMATAVSLNLFDAAEYQNGIVTNLLIRDICQGVQMNRESGRKRQDQFVQRRETVTHCEESTDEHAINVLVTEDIARDKTRLDNNTIVDSVKVANSSSDSEMYIQAEELFATLWAAYPRKEGKSAVKAAQKRRLLSVGKEKMIAAIDNYCRTIVGKDPKYTLMGSTFFNGRFEDYLEPIDITPAEKSLDDWIVGPDGIPERRGRV